MKKTLFIISLICVGIGITTLYSPAYAECPEGSVPTAIFGNTTGTDGEKCMSGTDDGSAVAYIIKYVIQSMSMGIGILAVLGITIVGIQYLTASGNEEKIRKSKRRMFEIVIGLITYSLIFTGLNFLIPDASLGPDSIEYEPATPQQTSQTNTSGNTSSSDSNGNIITPSTVADAKENADVRKLQDTVKEYTWPKYVKGRKNPKKDYYHLRGGGSYSQGVKDCGVYVRAMVRASGWDKNYNSNGFGNIGDSRKYKNKGNFQYMQKEWQDITSEIDKSVTASNQNGSLKPGDIITSGPYISGGRSHQHIMLFVGKIPGFQYQIVEASYGKFPGTSARSNNGTYYRFKKSNKGRPVHVYRRKSSV